MHRIATIVTAAAAVTAAAVAGAGPAFAAHHARTTAHHATAAPPESFYLSLGDSLSVGIQPNAKGKDEPTGVGYPNQLMDSLRMGNPFLHLKKLGCSGETTTTMMKGGICKYADGSQLAQAAAFLKAHAGHVQLVTVDIGANDLNKCLVLTNETKLIKCLEKVFPVTMKNLATIVGTLRAAGGSSLRIIGMTYYDPELAGWLKGTKAAQQLATASIPLAESFSNDMKAVYAKFGVPVANMYSAFQTADMKDTTTLPAFGKVPRDVGLICYYTWECAPKPQGPNEHANILGYGVIANAFLKVYARR